MLNPKNIVIRLPNWLGDAVMASPIPYLVKRAFPGASIALYGTRASLLLFKEDPNVNDFLVLDKDNPVQKETQILKELQFDLGLILTNSFSSAWLFYRAKIPMRAGFSKDLRGWLLTHSLPYPKDRSKMHHVYLYQELLKLIGVEQAREPKLFLSDQEKTWAGSFFKEKNIHGGCLVIGVNPSAAFGSSKCWLKERFRELAIELLKKNNIYLLFFGDNLAKEKNASICKDLDRCFNLAGQTSIRELMALIQKCDLFLTNDSGPMHIACALGTPVVALFGSTSPEATGPYGKGVYIRKKVECSPCFKRECPIDFRCMKAISVADVYQIIGQQLEKYQTEYAGKST